MKKSVYSLMLFDEIVERIDRLAYHQDTNRSQLINDLLADHLGISTPEQQVQKVIDQLDSNLNELLPVSQMTKNSSIQFGKSLKYKYRPKVLYSYEFVTDSGKKHAVLKVSSRTKSETLNRQFDDFFDKICRIEKQADFLVEEDVAHNTNHKFVRNLRDVGMVDSDTHHLSDFLTDYLKTIDQAMNVFFESDEQSEADRLIEEIYNQFFTRIK